jgi:hypothetical protein
MKNFLFTMLLAFLVQLCVAQDSTRHSFKSLQLSPAQKTKMTALKKEYRANRLAILTPEQRQQLAAQKKNRRGKKSGEKIPQPTSLNEAPVELTEANETLAAAQQQHRRRALVTAEQYTVPKGLQMKRQKPSDL